MACTSTRQLLGPYRVLAVERGHEQQPAPKVIELVVLHKPCRLGEPTARRDRVSILLALIEAQEDGGIGRLKGFSTFAEQREGTLPARHRLVELAQPPRHISSGPRRASPTASSPSAASNASRASVHRACCSASPPSASSDSRVPDTGRCYAAVARRECKSPRESHRDGQTDPIAEDTNRWSHLRRGRCGALDSAGGPGLDAPERRLHARRSAPPSRHTDVGEIASATPRAGRSVPLS